MWNGKAKRTLQFFLLAGAILGSLWAFSFAPTHAQSPDAIADLATRINRERTSRGMIPYALSAELNAAAQAHANDIARTGVNSHTGSDGSDVRDRVARAGYGAYSWGRRVGENWAFYFDAATAMRMWMNSAPHTHNILHPVYRELGIGIAPGKNSATIYVVDFGAQPNVLPIFIQADGRDISAGRVSLALSNENYAASGDGANTIGLVTQVEISNAPDFAGAQWQNYSPQVAWTLNGNLKTVYVKFRDARGRTTTSRDSLGSTAGVTTVPTLTPTLKLTATNTPQPRASATRSSLPLATIVVEPSETPAPTLVAVLDAFVASDAPIAARETPAPLPPNSAESIDPREEIQFSPFALGVFGVSIMLGVLVAVIFVGRRLNK